MMCLHNAAIQVQLDFGGLCNTHLLEGTNLNWNVHACIVLTTCTSIILSTCAAVLALFYCDCYFWQSQSVGGKRCDAILSIM